MIGHNPTVDLRVSLMGKALCWLRLVRGVQTLRMADRLYRERVNPNASEMAFASHLSKTERGLEHPTLGKVIAALEVYGSDFADLETGMEVMAVRDQEGNDALKRRLSEDSCLSQRITALLHTQSGKSGYAIGKVLDAAETAADR